MIVQVSATTEASRRSRRRHDRGRCLRRRAPERSRAARGAAGGRRRAAGLGRGARRIQGARAGARRWAALAAGGPGQAGRADARARARGRGDGARARAGDAARRRSAGRPAPADLAVCAALVEGMVLADYRFERHKSAPAEGVQDTTTKRLESLIVSAPATTAAELERTVSEAAIVAEAVNAARDLQNRPANDLTPTRAGRAHARRWPSRSRASRSRARAARGCSRAEWARSRRWRRAPSRSRR